MVWCPRCFEDVAGRGPCPACGFDERQRRSAGLLPYRHKLQDGRYVVGAELGRPGGFGAAYRALDRAQGALVVIKECLLTGSQQVFREPGQAWLQVHPGFEADYRRWLGRFHREAGHMRRLRSPHVVPVHDVFDENNTAYYVMPFIEGDTLDEVCKARGGTLPGQELVVLARQLLAALSDVHAQDLVHRDIKPSNILLTGPRRMPVLIDFGTARDHFDPGTSVSHMRAGSAGYAPYEQVTGQACQGPHTDLYGLGATLYRCLAAEAPPPVERRLQAEGERGQPSLPWPRGRPAEPAGLVALIERSLALLPEDRLPDATAALALLEEDRGRAEEPVAPKPTPPGLWRQLAQAGRGLLSQIKGPRPKKDALRLSLHAQGATLHTLSLPPGAALTVGSHAQSADLIVPSEWVSRAHVRISVAADGSFELRDCGSTNGTFNFIGGRHDRAESWRPVTAPVSGRQGRFMLGAPGKDGVMLEIEPCGNVNEPA